MAPLNISTIHAELHADNHPTKYALRNKLWWTEDGGIVLDGDERAAFYIGPAGRQFPREFAERRGIVAFEDALDAAANVTPEPESAEQLVKANTRDALLAIVEAEGVEGLADDATKSEIAEAIVAKRAATPAEE